MKIAQRAVRAQPFHAMSIGARARELESRGIRIAKLSLGEPSFGAPPGVHEAMRATMDGRALPYTPAAGLPALRRAVPGLYRPRPGGDEPDAAGNQHHGQPNPAQNAQRHLDAYGAYQQR